MRDAAPFGNVVFCDDVRHELRNKVSYIGVYRGQMTSEQFPLLLPKFAVVINYNQGLDLPRGALELRVIFEPFEGEIVPLASADVALDEAPDTPEAPGAELLTGTFEIIFSPLQLATPGHIRVRAYVDGEEQRLGGLTVLQAPLS